MFVIVGANTCSGSLISAAVVLRAAHCLVDRRGKPVATNSITVKAGTVADAALGRQKRRAAGFRIHPGFSYPDYFNDAAEISLEPFIGTSGDVAPIPVASARPKPWASYDFVGFGQSHPGDRSYHERSLTMTTQPQWSCALGVPSLICAVSATGDVCAGDSGGGLVRLHPTTLVGVLSSSPGKCGRGDVANFSDLASHEIAVWLAGDDSPMPAPRTNGFARLRGRARPGNLLTCRAPRWRKRARFSFLFVDVDTGSTLARARRYRIPHDMTGHDLGCVSVARNAAGTAMAHSRQILPVAARRG